MSELKSISGSASLPTGQLASGAEGIKEAIQGFDDASVDHVVLACTADTQAKERYRERASPTRHHRRKSLA